MVGVLDYIINFDAFDAGELLGEAAWKLSSHMAQQTGVVNTFNELQSARFDQLVVLHVDVLSVDVFSAHPFRFFVDFQSEIDLIHVHVGQLEAGESEPKVATSQPLRLVQELAHRFLDIVECANSIFEPDFN